MPMSNRERAATGGRATAAKLAPETRKAISSRAHLASCVAQVIQRAPELTPDQSTRLRALFAPVTE